MKFSQSLPFILAVFAVAGTAQAQIVTLPGQGGQYGTGNPGQGPGFPGQGQGPGQGFPGQGFPGQEFPGQGGGRQDDSLSYAAQAVRQQADVLAQVLMRENADYVVLYNARLVLDAALRLEEDACNPYASNEAYYDVQAVEEAMSNLENQWYYARVRPSYNAQYQLSLLERAVDDLRNAGQNQGGGVIILNP